MPARKIRLLGGNGMDNLPQRKQLRLRNYDYANAGYYFVTICTYGKHNFLCYICTANPKKGRVTMQNTDIGSLIESSILKIPSIFSGVYVDQYIIMPNHLHFIIVIEAGRKEAGGHGDPPLQDIIGRFKSFTTYEYNKVNKTKGKLLWQRSYYEHVIRNEDKLNSIRQYIIDNPAKWQDDKYFN